MHAYSYAYAPIIVKPHFPHLGIGGDLQNLLLKRDTAEALQCLTLDAPNILGQCGGFAYTFIYTIFHENIFKLLQITTITKSPLVGSIIQAKDTRIPTYARVGGSRASHYRCITPAGFTWCVFS